jgi:mannosyl-3-phosphoglycerate phosphatase
VSRLVIFTDLDGTLLDHDTYSWAEARPALLELRRLQVPLVFCTSKTRAEVAPLRRLLSNEHPFIVENGGGIVIPRNYFGRAAPAKISLGRPYSELAAALDELAQRSRVRVRGFHQLSVREIAAATGLSLGEARLAKKREFDEPFFFLGASKAGRQRFVRLARRRGLDLTTGGRFWHLFSGSDKGLAVRRLVALYRRAGPQPVRTLALGNAESDLAMFRVVDRAVLLPAKNGRFAGTVLRGLPRVVRGSASGPEGWNEAVLGVLAQRSR